MGLSVVFMRSRVFSGFLNRLSVGWHEADISFDIGIKHGHSRYFVAFKRLFKITPVFGLHQV